MDRPRGLVVGLFLLAALPFLRGAERDAAAQPRRTPQRTLAQSLPPDARRDYDAGKLLFEDGDYATALLKFRDAYNRTHDARLLWNVAVCLKNLRRYTMAAATLGRYLAEGGDLLSPGDRRDAQEFSRAIAPFTIPMTLHVSEPGARIRIDDVPVGESPLAGPVVLDMGTRHVKIEKEGYRLFDRELPVGGSAATTIDVTLERREGHLQLNVPRDATVWLDEKEVGHGPRLELDVAAGAHALRIAAPRMRPQLSDVEIDDGSARVLDFALEPDAVPSSELHVAVTCEKPDAVPADALFVDLDDAAESVMPMGERNRREFGPAVVAYVAYRIAPGRHRVHVSALRCEEQVLTVDVPNGAVIDVKGSLAPANRWLAASPAGSPDRWRLAAGLLWSSTRFGAYQNFFPNGQGLGSGYQGALTATQVGLVLTAGLQDRWVTALLDARVLSGRQTGTLVSQGPAQGATLPTGTPVASDSTLAGWTVGVRPGVRLPLVVAALSTGVGLHLGEYLFSADTGASRSGILLNASYWAAVDIQPFCEWGLQVAWSLSADAYSNTQYLVGDDGTNSVWASATYTPNTLCTRLRAGLDRIEATTR